MRKTAHRIGDVVQLLSGGPTMTVISVDDGEVTCAWFDNDARLATSEFPASVLKTHVSALTTTVEGLQRRGSDKIGMLG